MGQSESYIAHPLPPLEDDSIFLKKEWTDVVAYLETFHRNGVKPPQRISRWQWEMAQAHRFYLNKLERVYRYAPYAEAINDLGNFLGYAEVAFFHIYKHHQLEDVYIYPSFTAAANKDLWGVNSKEHEQFSHGLDAAWLYVRACREKIGLTSPIPPPPEEIIEMDPLADYPELDTTKPFSVTVLQKHMEGFMFILSKHMADEIETLKPENIALIPEVVEDELNEMVKKHLMQYDPAWFLCSGYAATPMSIGKQMVPVPWFVRRLLVPFLFAPKYRPFWRCCPFPENLTFSGTA